MKSRKSLVRECDKAFSDFIRERDGWRCVTCGETDREVLQCGHLFTRAAYSTRWNLDNCFCQCAACNLRNEYDPYPLTAYFLDRFGREKYDELHRLHRATVKFGNDMLQKMIEDFRAKRAELMLQKAAAWN